MGIRDFFKPKQKLLPQTNSTQTRNPYQYYVTDLLEAVWNGSKFPGSYGSTKDYTYVDYWLLRKRSMQLFKENAYARGMIKRILRNEIHKGLNLEASNISDVTGLDDENAIIWDESSELSFKLWADNAQLCDWRKKKKFGELQHDCRQTALLSGDCLVILHVDQKTGLPAVELVDGDNVKTPFGQETRTGNRIIHGVELDAFDRHAAYWIETITDTGTKYKRIPCFGEKSRRRIAWLVYGTDKRLDDVRGEPLLALVLYMLKELDRYRDSEQRAAVLNSIIPLFIQKSEAGPGSLPIGAGAVRRGQETVQDTDGVDRTFNIAKMLPGTIPDELNKGEIPVSFNTQRPNLGFVKFEEAIINTFAWACEIPPEIARLLFQSNFSASRQANNEFNVYLTYISWKFGNDFCQPIYEEFITASVLKDEITAPGFIDSYFSGDWRILRAWLNAEWTGLSRPSVDLLKDVQAAKEALALRVTTFDQQCRKISGMSFRTIVKKLAREKKLLDKAGLTSSIDETTTGEPATMAVNILNMSQKIDEITDRMDEANGR
jgi:lambda family phage portal protein